MIRKIILYSIPFILFHSYANAQATLHHNIDNANADYFGFKGDGSQNDAFVLDNLYASNVNHSNIEIPRSINWPGRNSKWVPHFPLGTTRFVNVNGFVINPTNLTDPVSGINALNFGDGVTSFTAGTNWDGPRLRFSRSNIKNDPSWTPMITFDQMNDGPSRNQQGSEVMRIMATSTPNSSGNMNGLRTYLRSSGHNYAGSFDVNHWSNTRAYGTNWVWDNIQEFAIVTPFVCPSDSSGDGAICTEYDENEIDFAGAGPEKDVTAYDPSRAVKKIFGAGISYNGMQMNDPNSSWAANKSYRIYQIIIVKDSHNKPYMFQALPSSWVPGRMSPHNTDKTGPTKPLWTFGTGDKIVDGNITWTGLGPFRFDLGTVLKFSGANDPEKGWVTRFGTLLETDTIWCYNALIDFSTAKFDPSLPYKVNMRVQPDTYLDLTDKATAATQNLHLLGYSSSDNALDYKVKKTTMLSVSDNGIIKSNGLLPNAIKSAPRSSTSKCSPGNFYDDARYHYYCVAPNNWKRVAWDSKPW